MDDSYLTKYEINQPNYTSPRLLGFICNTNSVLCFVNYFLIYQKSVALRSISKRKLHSSYWYFCSSRELYYVFGTLAVCSFVPSK